jgi:hypothetical protein
MAEIVKREFRGMLLADPRFCDANLSTSLTTATQTGATADSPVCQGNEAARMDAADLQTGSVVAATRWLQTRKAGGHGYPNPARVTWSETDGGTERSWMSPAQCLDFFWVGYESAGAYTFAAPATLGLADGSVLIVYRRSYVSGFERLCSVIIGAESVGYSTSTEVIIAEDQANSQMAGMCQLPNGRILLARGNRVGWYSDDSGNTWVESPGNTGAGGSYRVSLAYHGGYLTMVGDSGDRCYSHTSSDQGGNWTPDVGSDGDYSSFGAFSGASCLGLPDGGCGLIYVDQADSCLKWAVKPAPNAPFDVDNAVTIYDGDTFKASVDKYQDYADIAACIGQDGLVCVAFRLHDPTSVNTHGCRVAVARFSPAIRPGTIAGGGTTWFHPDCIWDYDGAVQDGEALDWDARNERAEKMALAPRGGGYLLVTGFFATSGTLDGSIGAFVLGGWSSLQYVPATFGRYSDAVIYGRCYASFIIPALSGWTQTGAGMTVLTVDGVTCNTACNALYEGDNYGGQVFAVATVKVTAGAITAEDNYIRVVRTDGATYHYSATLRLSSTGARLWDDNAGAAVGSDVSGLTASTHRQWLILNTGAVWVAYREQDDSEWVITHSVGTLTNDATPPVLVNSVRFGDTTAAGIAYWRWIAAFASEDAVAQGELSIFSGATIQKRGRPTSTRTQYLSSGLGFRSSGAPTFVGDQWQFPVRYSKGLDALDPVLTPSPARSWRSTATTEQKIAWDLDQNTGLLSPAIGLTVLNPLGRTWYLEASTDGVTWATLLTLDAAEGMNGLTFARSGDLVYQNGGSDAVYAVHADELVGGWAILTNGGTNYAAQILANSSGSWAGGGKGLLLRLQMPSSGSLPSSGTLAILWPAATRIAWSVTTTYRYWRVRVAALTLDATTSPQYLSASKLVIGPVLPFGQSYSWGRTVAMTAQQEIVTGRAGQRAVKQLGNPRRAVEFGWQDVVASIGIFSAWPDFVSGSSGHGALALARDPRMAEELILRQRGAKYPVVYLPAMTWAPGESPAVGTERALYGRIVSDTVSRVGTSGNEAYDEGFSIGNIRIEEEK